MEGWVEGVEKTAASLGADGAACEVQLRPSEDSVEL
jgi:hypothetical protein